MPKQFFFGTESIVEPAHGMSGKKVYRFSLYHARSLMTGPRKKRQFNGLMP